MVPFLDYLDYSFSKEPVSILATLPEYQQDEFFSVERRSYLVDQLDLRSDAWAALFRDIWRKIEQFGYVLIENLPFDPNNRLSIALASMLGTPLRHNSRVPFLVREITPRRGAQPLENYPHSDSPHWIHPNSMILLECKEEDQRKDVRSRIVTVWELEKLLLKRRPKLHRRLFEKRYPFILIPDDGDGGMQIQPVFTKEHEGGRLRTHVRFCYSDSQACVSKFALDAGCLDDLLFLQELAEELGEKKQFRFRRGDWLIFDNLRTLHSKTETSENSRRVLKKIKLQIDRRKVYEH